jgi:hypothetical protein
MRLLLVTASLAAAILSVTLGRPEAAASDQFHRLLGSEIKTRLTGRMLTDDTHWRETYLPGGQLLAEQMGGAPMRGNWRVEHDQLCSVLPGVRDGCYVVWQSNDRIQLRHTDYPTVDAFLRPPHR